MIEPTLDPGFTTERMSEVFSARSRVQALCRFEAELALALSDLGIAPREEASSVAVACTEPVADPEAILAATWEQGTPMSPLLETIGSRLANEADRHWLHHGATTQDAVDTATMLQSRDGLALIEESLAGTARALRDLVLEHISRPTMAQTFLQAAGPTTLGLRLAAWLEPMLRHIESLRSVRDGLAVQLGGPVGNLAGYGDIGPALVRTLAARLGLAAPSLPWHTDRTRLASLVAALESCSRSMAKIGVDVALLSQTGVGEIEVRGGTSSSIPGKHNPIDAIRAIAAAEACSSVAGVVTGGRPQELERGIGGWHAEWFAIPLVFQTTAASVEAADRCVTTLKADPARMAAHLGSVPVPDLASSEALARQVVEECDRLL